MGVLSALPLVAAGNCCCLWVISGGAIAAYLLQQNQTAPLTPADGALVGLLAGLIGAIVHFVVVDSGRPAGGADGAGDPAEDYRDLHAAAGSARRHRAVRPARSRDVGGLLRHQPHDRPDVLVVSGRRLLDARRAARRADLPQDPAAARRDRSSRLRPDTRTISFRLPWPIRKTTPRSTISSAKTAPFLLPPAFARARSSGMKACTPKPNAIPRRSGRSLPASSNGRAPGTRCSTGSRRMRNGSSAGR